MIVFLILVVLLLFAGISFFGIAAKVAGALLGILIVTVVFLRRRNR